MTLLDLYRAESHWSNPQRIREAATMMTASAYTVKGKDERIAELRKARDKAHRGAVEATSPALRKACDVASHQLSQAIGRILVMSDMDAIRREVESLPSVYGVKQLALASKLFPADAKKAGVEGIEWHLAFAASDT